MAKRKEPEKFEYEATVEGWHLGKLMEKGEKVTATEAEAKYDVISGSLKKVEGKDADKDPAPASASTKTPETEAEEKAIVSPGTSEPLAGKSASSNANTKRSK